MDRLLEDMWTVLLNPPDHPRGDTPLTVLFKLLSNPACFCLDFFVRRPFISTE